MSDGFVQLTDDQYIAEIERLSTALDTHLRSMANPDGMLNLEAMVVSFAIVMAQYLGRIPSPDEIARLINRFDEIFDDQLDQYTVPAGTVIQ